MILIFKQKLMDGWNFHSILDQKKNNQSIITKYFISIFKTPQYINYFSFYFYFLFIVFFIWFFFYLIIIYWYDLLLYNDDNNNKQCHLTHLNMSFVPVSFSSIVNFKKDNNLGYTGGDKRGQKRKQICHYYLADFFKILYQKKCLQRRKQNNRKKPRKYIE